MFGNYFLTYQLCYLFVVCQYLQSTLRTSLIACSQTSFKVSEEVAISLDDRRQSCSCGTFEDSKVDKTHETTDFRLKVDIVLVANLAIQQGKVHVRTTIFNNKTLRISRCKIAYTKTAKHMRAGNLAEQMRLLRMLAPYGEVDDRVLTRYPHNSLGIWQPPLLQLLLPL